MPFADLPPEVAHVLVGTWLFLFGACVGSFLNVVVYRLPAGMSLVWPGSHCPRCDHAIRWFDNVPILAWFWLRGRCRDCHASISFRYPAIEALTAAVFLAVGWSEGVWGRVPPRPIALADAVIAPAWTGPQLLGLTMYHLLLLTTLLPAALIAWDRRAIPVRLFVPALAVGLAAPLMAGAWLRPVPCALAWGGSMTDGLIGALAGAACGAVTAGLWRQWRLGAAAVATVGAVLGWQAACGIAAATIVLSLPLLLLGWRRPQARRGLWPAVLAVATLAWLLFWPSASELLPGLAAG